MKVKSYLYIHEDDQELFLNLVMQEYFCEAYEMYCRLADSIVSSLKEQTFGLIDFREMAREIDNE